MLHALLSHNLPPSSSNTANSPLYTTPTQRQRRRPQQNLQRRIHRHTHCVRTRIVRVIHPSWRPRRQPRRPRLRPPLYLTSRRRQRSYLLLPMGAWTRLSEKIGRRRFRSSWRGLRYRWYVFHLSPFLDASAYRTGYIGWSQKLFCLSECHRLWCTIIICCIGPASGQSCTTLSICPAY